MLIYLPMTFCEILANSSTIAVFNLSMIVTAVNIAFEYIPDGSSEVCLRANTLVGAISGNFL